MKIGIPRSLYFYYYGSLWKKFFEKLGFEVILSPKTNNEIISIGNKVSNDEMCLSLKNYLGHVFYLQDKCDYIIIPRIDNYGTSNQTCTNFLATYDIINNLGDFNIINYNINLNKKETELKAFYNIGKQLKIKKKQIKEAYTEAIEEIEIENNQKITSNIRNLKSKKIKILLIGHPYNLYDELIGKPIIDYLKQSNIELIYSDQFDSEITNNLSGKLSKELYFKYNKENIGCIPLVEDKIYGIIFISSFPCGPDSLVNELVIRKITLPYLNIIIDDTNTTTGLITRLESFIDILEVKNG